MYSEFSDGRSYFERVEFGAESADEIVCVNERRVYSNGYLNVFDDEVVFPNGHNGHFLRLETPGRQDGTVVVAVNARNELAVVKQFRYAPRVWTLEFPRGFVGPSDAGPFLTGWREFQEEVGGALDVAESWSLGRVLTDTGKFHDAPYIIMARLAAQESSILPQEPDVTEVINHKRGGSWLSYLQLRDMVETGLILDMFTCAAFGRLRPHFDDQGRFTPDKAILRREHIEKAELILRY